MRGKLHWGEEQACHEVSRLELWLFHPIDIKLKQRHLTGATSFLIKRPVQFSGCIMWAEAKPRVRKGDPRSLCLSLSGLVHRLGAGGKGTESGCQDRRSACGSSSVSLTQSRAECDQPCSEWSPRTAQTDGNSSSEEGVASLMEPNSPSTVTFIPLDFKSEKRGAQKQNISSGALGREHT